jgi:hypothetical protein
MACLAAITGCAPLLLAVLILALSDPSVQPLTPGQFIGLTGIAVVMLAFARWLNNRG